MQTYLRSRTEDDGILRTLLCGTITSLGVDFIKSEVEVRLLPHGRSQVRHTTPGTRPPHLFRVRAGKC